MRDTDMNINSIRCVPHVETFTMICGRLVGALEYPVFYLYLNGPKVFGFWQGLTSDHICASFTGVPSSHWIQNQNECDILITKSFRSWLMIPYVLVYCAVICHFVTMLWFNCKRQCTWVVSGTDTLRLERSRF